MQQSFVIFITYFIIYIGFRPSCSADILLSEVEDQPTHYPNHVAKQVFHASGSCVGVFDTCWTLERRHTMVAYQ